MTIGVRNGTVMMCTPKVGHKQHQLCRRYKQKYRLTAEGEAVARDVQATAKRVQAAVSKDITDDDLDVFYGTLYKLCENFGELLEKEL